MKPIYLDFNASTPVAPEVVEAMAPYWNEVYGNPSGLHWAGLPGREAVETARRQVADLLGSLPEEIVFTSGGTESNNHAIKGTYFALQEKGNHVITTAVEHPAVLEPCRFLERIGAKVTVLPVDETGWVHPDDVRRAVTPGTILISVMHANNEVGTVQPIEEIANVAREKGVAFHTDAAQSVGKIPARVGDLGVDLLSVAGHKLYGPKGVGVLYIRKGTRLEPLLHGAGHESGRRAGTENVPLAVGLGKACELARDLGGMERIKTLRDRLHHGLMEKFGDRISLNGHPTMRLPNTLNVNFMGFTGSEILSRLDGIAASTGSACHSGSVHLSPILRAMGISPETGRGAVRFSLGRSTTAEEIEEVLHQLTRILP